MRNNCPMLLLWPGGDAAGVYNAPEGQRKEEEADEEQLSDVLRWNAREGRVLQSVQIGPAQQEGQQHERSHKKAQAFAHLRVVELAQPREHRGQQGRECHFLYRSFPHRLLIRSRCRLGAVWRISCAGSFHGSGQVTR